MIWEAFGVLGHKILFISYFHSALGRMGLRDFYGMDEGFSIPLPIIFGSVVLHPELLSPEVDVSGAKRGIVCSALPLSPAACPQDPTKALGGSACGLMLREERGGAAREFKFKMKANKICISKSF